MSSRAVSTSISLKSVENRNLVGRGHHGFQFIADFSNPSFIDVFRLQVFLLKCWKFVSPELVVVYQRHQSCDYCYVSRRVFDICGSILLYISLCNLSVCAF